MDTNLLCEQLIALVKDKKQKLEDILEYTKFQTTAIEKQDNKNLHKYIDGKQNIIDKINDLDEQFVEKFDSLKKALGVETLDEVDSENELLKQLKAELNEVYKVIEQIFELEKENNVKVNKEFDDIKDKLREVSGGKQAFSAYKGARKSTGGGAFFDKKK